MKAVAEREIIFIIEGPKSLGHGTRQAMGSRRVDVRRAISVVQDSPENLTASSVRVRGGDFEASWFI